MGGQFERSAHYRAESEEIARMYSIKYSEGVADDLAALRAYDRAHILDSMEVQLKYQPTVQTRNRKILVGLIPPWEHVEPVWELRIGEFRVFYDVDEEISVVVVRAIRHKPPHKTTEEIL
jgi:mRNA-degrading endonuclease RelE of RelBE toxin-antitoxin system